MYQVALLFAIVATAQAQLVSNGNCTFPPVSESQINKFRSSVTLTVNMFEIKRINNTLNTGQCTSVSLVATNDGVSVSLKEVVDEKLIDHNATVTVDGNTQVFNLVFSDFTSNFTLIGYGDEFVVLYACSDQGEQKQEYAWVLGLNRTLTEAEKNATESIIKYNKLANATWVQSSHTEDSCRSGATNNIKLSSVLVLIIGFVAAKEL